MKILNVAEVAAHFGVSEPAVRVWCRMGIVPGALHIGEGNTPWAIPEGALQDADLIQHAAYAKRHGGFIRSGQRRRRMRVHASADARESDCNN